MQHSFKDAPVDYFFQALAPGDLGKVRFNNLNNNLKYSELTVCSNHFKTLLLAIGLHN